MKDPSRWVYEQEHEPGTVGRLNVEKHETERIQNGFSDCDWFNFNSYLAWIIHGGLVKFRNEGSGFPANLTKETWHFMLDTMIDGFEAFAELESMEDWDTHVPYDEWAAPIQARWESGKQLFIDNFENLWD